MITSTEASWHGAVKGSFLGFIHIAHTVKSHYYNIIRIRGKVQYIQTIDIPNLILAYLAMAGILKYQSAVDAKLIIHQRQKDLTVYTNDW